MSAANHTANGTLKQAQKARAMLASVVVMAARNIDCDVREGKITEASALDRLCEMFSAARVCGDDEASRCYSDALEARAALRQAGGVA